MRLSLKNIESFIWSEKWKNKAWPIKKFFNFIQIFHLSIKGLKADKIRFYSAALTYYSILSIVPVFALIFAVTKGFNLEKILEKFLLAQLQGQEIVVKKLLELARSLLEKARSGVIAGVGVLFLIWAVIRVFSEIDEAINDIWRVNKRRNLGRKFTDYFSLIIVAPIFYITSNSISIFLSHKFLYIANYINLPHGITSLIMFSFKLIPLFLLFILFSFVYVYIPTTNVKLKYAFLAGFIIALFYMIFQRITINVYLNINRYSAIYGSLAMLPMLIIWINLSWILILFGAKLAYVAQNFEKALFDLKNYKLNIRNRKLVSMFLWGIIGNYYIKNNKAVSFDELLSLSNIPISVVQICLNDLLKCKLVGKLEDESSKDVSFIPLYDPHVLTVGEFLNSIEIEGITSSVDIPQIKEISILEEKKIKELNCLVIDEVKI